MTKADLVEQVADAIGPGITKKDCALVVDGLLNAIKGALADHENIEIRGFGTFKVRERRSRVARNPRTGERVEVAARAVPVFKPSKDLREQVEEADLQRAVAAGN
jgi:integration host factor subunit beta